MNLNDLHKLYRDGFLSEEQRDAAIERYLPNPSGMRRMVVRSLAALAAGLMIGGVLMLVGAHWEELSDTTKMGMGIGLLAAVWMGYFALRCTAPIAAEALSAVGAGVWLADLMLLVSIFQPTTTVAETGLVFFAGIALIPFLTRQRLLIGVVAVASLVQYTLMVTEEAGHGLSLGWMQQHNMLVPMVFLLLTLFWWLLAERLRDSKGTTRGYGWVGVPAFLAFLLVVQSGLLYHKLPFTDHYQNRLTPPYDWELYAVAPLLFLLLKPRQVSWGCWLLLAVATSALLPAIEYFFWPHNVVCGLCVCAAYAFVLIFIGGRSARAAWINYGSIMVVFTFMGLISNILNSQENSGLVLVISGVGMLAFALLLEWQRRRLIYRAKQKAIGLGAPVIPTPAAPQPTPTTEA